MGLCNGNRVFFLGQETIFKYHLQESQYFKRLRLGKDRDFKNAKNPAHIKYSIMYLSTIHISDAHCMEIRIIMS
jgi:hypothetical protein